MSVLVKEEGNLRWLNKAISSSIELQSLCKGCVDRISLPYHIDLWINDESAVNGMGINLILLWDEDRRYHQPVFGPVVLAGVDEYGKTISLSKRQRQWIAKHLMVALLSNGEQICTIDLRMGGAIA